MGWSNPWLAWPASVLATLAMTVLFIWVLVELFHL
jgi:hypothetical protein